MTNTEAGRASYPGNADEISAGTDAGRTGGTADRSVELLTCTIG
mgnify:FL=1